MALTKIGKEGVTGISNSSDANAITIDSSERVGIGTSPNAKLDIKDDSNSTQAILRGRSSDNFGILDFRNNAGDTVKGQVKSDASSNLILRAGSTNDALKIDTNGHITKPLQPAFSVHKSNADQSNIAEGVAVTITFAGERYDQNSDFASNTFTAPVTGKYFFNLTVRLKQVDDAVHYYYILIKTSNINYGSIFDTRVFDTDSAFFTMQTSILADMDANDTAYAVVLQEASGVVQTDIHGDPSYTYFTGHLVC